MDHLRRQLAPLSDAAWQAVEEEARQTIRHILAARALVDVEGPLGWGYSAHPCGRAVPLPDGPREGVSAAGRAVQPLVELRTPFRLSVDELDTIERGNQAPDLDPVTEAANRAGLAEDAAVFQGFAAAGIAGIVEASAHAPVPLTTDYSQYPTAVAKAVATLRTAGVGGPYGIALGPRCYTGVIETTEKGGYPLLEHLKMILGGPVVWAPAVDGAIVLSRRGGDFALILGEDFSIGYAGSDGSSVDLYLEESLTFEVREPKAAIALRY